VYEKKQPRQAAPVLGSIWKRALLLPKASGLPGPPGMPPPCTWVRESKHTIVTCCFSRAPATAAHPDGSQRRLQASIGCRHQKDAPAPDFLAAPTWRRERRKRPPTSSRGKARLPSRLRNTAPPSSELECAAKSTPLSLHGRECAGSAVKGWLWWAHRVVRRNGTLHTKHVCSTPGSCLAQAQQRPVCAPRSPELPQPPAGRTGHPEPARLASVAPVGYRNGPGTVVWHYVVPAG